GRQHIAEREQARENDPALMQDHLLAAHEPIRRPLVEQTNELGLITRDYAGNAQALAAEPDADGLDDYTRAICRYVVEYTRQNLPERDQRLDIHENEIVALKRLVRESIERDRKIGILEGELREVKGMLGATLTLLGQKSADVS